MTNFIIFLAIGYLLGSLSCAVIICKIMKLSDPRTQGSNNPGATNVMRIGGKKAAYATFFGDFLKGLLPVIIAKLTIDTDIVIAGAAVGAFIGHIYPLYFGFKGGKGVATFIGILVGTNIVLSLAFIISWLAIFFITRYVSLASMLGSIVVVIVTLVLNFSNTIIVTFMMLTILVIYRHHENIKNLLNGSENNFKNK